MYPTSKKKSEQKFTTSGSSLVPSVSMPTLATKSVNPRELRPNHMVRKTSVENVSESKRMLPNGVRLVSTRRPITPRESKRQLYGKISLADRPPSAFSLSYLQVESRVLPPIEIPCRSPKLSNLNSVSTSNVCIKTISNDISSNSSSTVQPLQALDHHHHLHRSGNTTTIGNGNGSGSGSGNGNSHDLRIKDNNEFNANSCISEKIDNNLNIGANSMINSNNKTKANRGNGNANGQTKLPTLMTDTKSAIPTNYETSSESQTVTTDNIGSDKTKRIDNKNFNSDNIQSTCLATMSIGDILEHDEQILALADEANQSSVKKPISEQRRLLLLRGNDLLAQSSTETLLDMLKSHSGIKDCSDETVLHINGILTELYARVKDIRSDQRCSILSSLYGLVECTSAKILLSVARVVFALCVTGSNLTGACKLVFKIARNERNDYLFGNVDVPELLIDGLGRASPIEDAEACIYGYGAVRFLANAEITMITSGNRNSISISNSNLSSQSTTRKSKTLACRLIRHGALPLMILHLQMINEAGAIAKLQSSSLHALYQLCSALRVLSKILMSDPDLQTIISENVQKKSSSASSREKKMRRSNRSLDSIQLAIESSTDFDVQIVQAGPHLIRSAEICIDQIEVQLSVIRTLSVLSEHDCCCDGIVDMASRLGILLGPIIMDLPNNNNNSSSSSSSSNDDDPNMRMRTKMKMKTRSCASNETATMASHKSLGLLNRIGYILGNIMAKSDSARQYFYNNDAAMEYLLKTLECYTSDQLMLKRRKSGGSSSIGGAGNGGVINEDIRNATDDDTNECQFDTAIDVVIKLIRVVANLSVNAEVGYKLANFHQLGVILLTILNTINNYHMNFVSEFEELLLATLGAIHNLSFYQDAINIESISGTVNSDGSIGIHAKSMIKQLAPISATLCSIYKWTTDPIKWEIARVLGNLTRSLDARVAVHSAGGLQFLVKNLESDDCDIVGTSCGVLVNMLSDWERRAQFRELNGPLLLRNVLQRSAIRQDWLLALIACQALWNYIIDSGNVIGALGEDEADYISAHILEYLDEEKLFGKFPPDAEWEEFAIVAADLLERIQSSLSYNNSAYASSEEDETNDIANNEAMNENMPKSRFDTWLASS